MASIRNANQLRTRANSPGGGELRQADDGAAPVGAGELETTGIGRRCEAGRMTVSSE